MRRSERKRTGVHVHFFFLLLSSLSFFFHFPSSPHCECAQFVYAIQSHACGILLPWFPYISTRNHQYIIFYPSPFSFSHWSNTVFCLSLFFLLSFFVPLSLPLSPKPSSNLNATSYSLSHCRFRRWRWSWSPPRPSIRSYRTNPKSTACWRVARAFPRSSERRERERERERVCVCVSESECEWVNET